MLDRGSDAAENAAMLDWCSDCALETASDDAVDVRTAAGEMAGAGENPVVGDSRLLTLGLTPAPLAGDAFSWV